MIKQIKKDFLVGLFVILPAGITLFIMMKLLSILDGILGTTIYALIGMKIPGLGLLVTLVLVTLIGLLAKSVVGKQLTEMTDSLFVSFPMLKVIYKPVKDIVANFSDKNSNNFKKAVLVTYPYEGSQSMGFITKENIVVGEETKTAIFIPTTPNPTSGFLVYLTKDHYSELDISVDEALKSIISLGSVSPDTINFSANQMTK